MATFKRTVCLDFDGVCNLYTGWKGEDELFAPRNGLMEFILAMQGQGRRVAVFSTRPAEKLEAWFLQHFGDPATALIALGDLFFPAKKPPADVYIDDRAILFTGSFDGLDEKAVIFKAHWEI
jgi:hypothetical protein